MIKEETHYKSSLPQ
jgi:diacylglycerol kinase